MFFSSIFLNNMSIFQSKQYSRNSVNRRLGYTRSSPQIQWPWDLVTVLRNTGAA